MRIEIPTIKDYFVKASSVESKSLNNNLGTEVYVNQEISKDVRLIAERVQEANLDLTPRHSPYKQLGYKTKKKLKNKVEDRTITKEEWKRLEWNRRLAARRDEGVEKFWDQERFRIENGEPTTRDWSKEQIEDILNDKVPKFNGKTIAGHHSYSVSKFPHLANKGEIIYPATPNEHFKRWHGGAYRRSLPGKPYKPSYPEEF
ncbi:MULTISPECIES: hypothetical protein [unclassified Bacillus cereus group]|uniref:hypothetical protein n=1 Tax=unclassified Bacillus cereus group TaxID=2750818 RepID=UPI001F5A0617|nr:MULTISPECIES: hypothetical protein [unclassified Bacillus cereus group]